MPPKKKVKKDLSNLIIAGTAKVEVPKHMLFYTKTGQEKEINTLTKTGKITTRNNKPIIKFENINDDTVHISNFGSTQKMENIKNDVKKNEIQRSILIKGLNKLKEEIKSLNPKKDKAKIEQLKSDIKEKDKMIEKPYYKIQTLERNLRDMTRIHF